MSKEVKENEITNKFELCLIANERAKKLAAGVKTTLDNNLKAPIIALKEIEENLVDINELRKIIVEGEKHEDTDNNEDEISDNTQAAFLLEDEKEFY